MPRRVQDIKPGDKRSIRNVALEETHSMEKEKSEPAHQKSHSMSGVRVHRIPSNSSAHKTAIPKGKKRSWWPAFVVVGIVLLISAAGFFASAKLAKATFFIVPMSKPVSVNSTLMIDDKIGASNQIYEVVTLRGSASTTISASNGPIIALKAQGKVIINNTYSTTTQKLVAGTRLMGSSGLIYRLTSTVIVPGYLKSPTGGVTPGSVSASIIADQAGVEYNISRSDAVSNLKIVAYKGTARYDSIYAQLSSAITGGFTGANKTVDKSLLASTTLVLQSSITDTLLQKVKLTLSENRIFYDGAYIANFDAPVVTGTEEKNATVSLSGTLYAITFNKAGLVAKLSGTDTINSFAGFSFDPQGLESLSFVLTKPKDFTPEWKKPLVAIFKGEMKLVGLPPVEQLKKDLAGKALGDTRSILNRYSPIIDKEKSYGEVAPSWIGSVPSDLSRISVVVKSAN